MDNQIDKVLQNEENIYKFDEEYNNQLMNEKPWTKE